MQRGFTLLELLIVLAIAGLLASLTAPSLMQAWERSQYRLEQHRLHTLIEQTSFLAYARGEALSLALEGRLVRRLQQDEVLKEFRFEHLVVEPHTLHFNPHGFLQGHQPTLRITPAGYNLPWHEITPAVQTVASP